MLREISLGWRALLSSEISCDVNFLLHLLGHEIEVWHASLVSKNKNGREFEQLSELIPIAF